MTTTAPPQTFADVEAIFAEELPGYTPRPPQREAAAVIEQAVADGSIALVEAGTGTGKSFAGLIPLILAGIHAGKRAVVAVPVKALQDQYVGDLRFLSRFIKFTWAILKGRSNYYCHAAAGSLEFPTPAQQAAIQLVEINGTETGDRAEFAPMENGDWSGLSTSAAECPGKKNCKFGDVCFTEAAKDRAAGSQVVVTNLAYLMTDLVLRDQTGGAVSLLGDFDQLLIDEAHELEDSVTNALADSIGLGSMIRLTRDADNFLHDVGLEETAFRIRALAEPMWEKIDRAYDTWMQQNKITKPEPMGLPVETIITRLGDDIEGIVAAITSVRDQVSAYRADEDTKHAKYRALRKLDDWKGRWLAFATDAPDKTVRWVEREVQQVRGRKETRTYLRSAPVHAGPFLREHLWETTPTVMMSATLAVKGKFDYHAERFGLEGYSPATFITPSPFDYSTQALVYVPQGDAPKPTGATAQAWRTYAITATQGLVTAAKGGALLLFTSRVGMNDTYRALADVFRSQGLTVLRQGDAEPPELIRRFKQGGAVLFGLATFFQGIDVQGDACRLVVIDKLPFAVPTDVLVKARSDAYDRKFGQKKSFAGLAMPAMAMMLIQGFGRLIRHVNDRGVVAILDPRLEGTGYGRQIEAMLPPAPVTTDIHEAVRFLSAG